MSIEKVRGASVATFPTDRKSLTNFQRSDKPNVTFFKRMVDLIEFDGIKDATWVALMAAGRIEDTVWGGFKEDTHEAAKLLWNKVHADPEHPIHDHAPSFYEFKQKMRRAVAIRWPKLARDYRIALYEEEVVEDQDEQEEAHG